MNKFQERYQGDPCAFVREILGVTTNFPKQDEILRSVRDNPRTAVVAGNGCGKTVMAAEAVLWVAACYTESLVITTGPTKRQVDKQLWGEIHNLYRRARCPLGGELLTTELRFPKTGSRALGFSTTDGGRFEGWHAPRVFVVLDEAKSLTQEIFDAKERLLSAGEWVRLLVISTPGGRTGPFYDIFAKAGHLYTPFKITAYDSPFTLPEWREALKAQYGEESTMYKSAVLAEFPTSSHDGVLIPLEILERLQDHPPEATGSELRAGVDLAAGGGDECVFTVFEGNRQTVLDYWQEPDEMKTVSIVIEMVHRYGIPWGNVFIDADGIGGPMIRRMEEQGYCPNRVYNGGSPFDDVHYARANAEMWAITASKIQSGEVILKDDPMLLSQLSSRKKKPRSDGKLELETKTEMKRRGVHSPDRADAVVMAIAGQRKCSLRIDNVIEDVTEGKVDPDQWKKEHFRRAQQEADKIRAERGELPGTYLP